MYPPIFSKKNYNGFIGVTVLMLVMTSLLPRLLDVSMIRCFSVLIFLCQQVTHTKTIYEEKSVIVKIVNMTSKRAFHNSVTDFNDRKRGFT